MAPFYRADFAAADNYDSQQAAKLLDEAGWKQSAPGKVRTRAGKPLVVYIPIQASTSTPERTLWEQVRATARQVGYDVKLQPVSDAASTERQSQSDYDVSLGSDTGTPIPQRSCGSCLVQYFSARVGGYHRNDSGFNNPKFDRIIEQALETQDKERRRQLYHQAQQIIPDNYLQLRTYPQSPRLGIYKTTQGVALEPSYR